MFRPAPNVPGSAAEVPVLRVSVGGKREVPVLRVSGREVTAVLL